MMGKRISQSSKGRIVSKGHDGGKPSSPGISAYTKPVKLQPPVTQQKHKEMPVIPYIRPDDNETILPRYTALLSRSTEEGIAMDEVDSIQVELENLLCTVALRTRMLRSEIENIDLNESKREKKGKAAGKQLQYPGKRKYQEDRTIKPKEHSKTCQPKVAKFKNFTPVINTAASQGSFSHDNILISDNTVKLDMPPFAALPKNNTPFKFWTSVEPYCGPITQDDIKFLESLLATSSTLSPPAIPPLGKHYSEVWADEHVTEDQISSNPYKHKSSGISSEAANLRKKSEKNCDMIPGPFTQRLVTALMEDNPNQFENSDSKVRPSPNKTSNAIRNSLSLERCLRKELIEQGILDPEDLPPLTNPADDEILTEIKKCQAELAIVRKENCRNLRNLIAQCKQEMIRINLKKQLDQVDAECLEAYKKIQLAKQKKRPVTKKERDDAWKAVNEQIRLNNEINALPVTGPNSV